ncbi:TFIIB-type zinc ribbon-containing protein [Candidatus Methanoperedens nitratireducens]
MPYPSWAYRCPNCWSTSIKKRTRLGGYYCQSCGTIFQQPVKQD